jgi:hypothetical protein
VYISISNDFASIIPDQTEYELDEGELKKYLDIVIKEVKKGETVPDS